MSESIELKMDPKYEANNIALDITNLWVKWSVAKNKWLDEKKELREYLFATSTRDTTNGQLPWKNSTVTPKLTQIRDNLHANYIAAMFPAEEWFIWESAAKDQANTDKKDAIQAYMQSKVKASDFDIVASQLVLDYIDYGNVFAAHEYVNITKTDPDTNEEIVVYRGPRAYRISPLDICFDPTAPSFARSPVIIRTLRSLSDLKKDVATKPTIGYDMEVLEKVFECRRGTQSGAPFEYIDQLKSSGLTIDGFGTWEEYLSSGMVEILEFYGDYYDSFSDTLYQDNIVTVIDRRWVLKKQGNPSWLGTRPIFHCGWRLRPDNLWAQGPLDQLVGMQYRIDHLENLRADVFDQIAHPVTVITGDTVQDFTFQPGIQIHVGAEGKVDFPRPDSTALAADMQIDVLMQKMEEMAGAPKQAMGIRTPGEKTKYEVQVLENGAGRIFQNKAVWFEKNLIEPLLNSMLEESVRSLTVAEDIKFIDPDLGVEEFKSITATDIKGRGKLYPVGARHFAEQAKFIQELSQTLLSMEKLEIVKPHISGKAVAHALEDAFGWKRYGIFKDNIAVAEQAETQRLVQTASESLQVEQGLPSEPQPEDYTGGSNEQSTNEAQASQPNQATMGAAMGGGRGPVGTPS